MNHTLGNIQTMGEFERTLPWGTFGRKSMLKALYRCGKFREKVDCECIIPFEGHLD
jgi:hypothetical protein